MTNIIFKVVKYGGDEHAEAIALRKEVLYEARGISTADYNEEDRHIQIVGFSDGIIIATCSLVPDDDHCRMRYVAIKTIFKALELALKCWYFLKSKQEIKDLNLSIVMQEIRLSISILKMVIKPRVKCLSKLPSLMLK